MSDTLHPVVKIKVGGKEFNVPPNYLMEFEEKCILSGYAETTLKLTDPSYVDLEKSIVGGAGSTGLVQYCWGYPGQKFTDWREFATLFILPDIGERGYQLTINGKATVTASVAQVEPMAFRGKISDVVVQVTQELHKRMKKAGSVNGIRKAYIEETNDDDPAGVPGSIAFPDVVVPPYLPGAQPQDNSSRVWYTGNRSLLTFVREILRPYAVSKQTQSADYIFNVSPQGDLHFHSRGWAKGQVYDLTSGTWSEGKIPGVKYRTFNFLWSNPKGVRNFRPTINSAIIGGNARGWVCSTFDPKTKQYAEAAVNRSTLRGDESNSRTLMGPPDPDNPQSTKVADLFIHEPSSVDLGPERAMSRLANQFRFLNESITAAVLELIGLPEYVNFSPDEEYCIINVLLPSVKGGPNNLHWESGQYFIKDVTHRITGGYDITANLFRATALDGPFDSKTAAKSVNQTASVLMDGVFRALRR